MTVFESFQIHCIPQNTQGEPAATGSVKGFYKLVVMGVPSFEKPILTLYFWCKSRGGKTLQYLHPYWVVVVACASCVSIQGFTVMSHQVSVQICFVTSRLYQYSIDFCTIFFFFYRRNPVDFQILMHCKPHQHFPSDIYASFIAGSEWRILGSDIRSKRCVNPLKNPQKNQMLTDFNIRIRSSTGL